VDISRATEIDLDGIMDLQTANQPERGGTLSASLPRSRIAKMMRALPLIVARCSGRITGFLMTSTREMNADVPIIRAMLAAYPGATDAYVYGPICVSAEERGKGLAQAMFAELQRLLPRLEKITALSVGRGGVRARFYDRIEVRCSTRAESVMQSLTRR
jgi:predicted GNAT superfamily acetyltransferase